MSAEIGVLRGVLSLNSAAFEKGAKRAEASMNGMQRKMAATSAKMSKIGKRLSVGVTAPMVALGTVTVKRTLDAIDAQAKLAQSLGTTVKSMQVLERAGELAGVSMGEIETTAAAMTLRLSKAASGAGPAAKALDRLGLSANDLVKLPLDQRILQINGAIEDMIPAAERAAVAGDLFGRTGAVAFGRLDTSTLRTAADDVNRFGIAISEADAEQIEVANDAISRLALVGKGLGNQLTASLAPALEQMANSAAGVADWFNGLSDSTQRFVGVGALVAGAAGPAAMALGLMTAAIIPLATPIGAVVLGLGALAAGAAYVAYNWDDLATRFPVLQSIADGLAVAFDAVRDAWVPVWSYISEQVGLAVDLIGALLQGDLVGAVSFAGDMVGNALDVMAAAFSGLWGVVQPVLAQFAADAAAWAVALPERIGAGLVDLGGVVAGKFAGLSAEVQTALGAVASDALIWAGDIAARVGDGLASLPDLARGAVVDMSARMIAALKGVGAQALAAAKEIGGFVIDGITAGIDAKWQALKNKVAAIGDFLPNWLRKDLKIHSPSRVMKEIGGFVVDGLVVGMDGGAGGLRNSAASLSDTVTDVFTQMQGDIAGIVGDLFSGLGDGISGAIDQIKSTLQRGLSSAISGGLQVEVSGASTGSVVQGAAQSGSGVLSGLSGLAGGKGILGSIASKGIFGATGVFGSIGSTLGTSIGSALGGAGSALATSLGGIGASIGAVVPILGIAAAAFSFFKKSVKELDAGIRLTAEGLNLAVDSFSEKETKRFWGLSKKVSTAWTAAEAAISDPITKIVSTMQSGVLAAALALGVGGAAYADFAHEITVSTKDLSEDEAQAAITEALNGVGNAFADLTPQLAQFIREGEESGATLTRIVSDLGSVNQMLDTLGHTLMDVSVIGAGTASNFAALFGGIDAMNTATTAYYAGFYSEAEQFATATRQIEAQFAAINVTMPKTRDAFRGLVDGLDTSSESGREMYAALVSMSGALDAVLPSVASFTAEIAALGLSTATLIDAVISDTSTLMQANETAAALWYRTADTLRDFIADLRGTASELTSGAAARAFSEARFQSLLASAIGGDNDAADDLTAAASTLLDNTRATARTSLEMARAEARVLNDLSLVSGVSDVEGARHDVVAGLLGQQVDLLGTVRDAINSGNPLEASDIDGLNGQLGSLESAIQAAEMINYAFLKERLNVSVDLIADAQIPAALRTMLDNAATGITASLDYIVRADGLTPDLRWIALTGASEHIKTVSFAASNSLPADLLGIALASSDTITRSVRAVLASGVEIDAKRIALAGNSELQRIVNVSLSSGASADAVKLALANVGSYAVAVSASLSATADVRAIVFADSGSYAAMIEAAFSSDLSVDMRRVLLEQQGTYALNVLGIMAAHNTNHMNAMLRDGSTTGIRKLDILGGIKGGVSDAVTALLLKENTTAIRAVTVGMVFDSAVTGAERDLLLVNGKSILRTISAGVNLGGIDALGAKYFSQLNAGSGAIRRVLDGSVNIGSLTKAQVSLLEAVQGNSTGNLNLGGSFSFDPSTGFQTWYSDATQANITAPMGALRTSLDALTQAIRLDAVTSEASGYASKLLNAGGGQVIATDDQVTKLASIMGINTGQTQAALRSQVSAFSAGDAIDSISSYTPALRDYLIGMTGTAGLEVDQGQYLKARPGVATSEMFNGDAQAHWDKFGRAEMAANANWFNPRLFDWSSIGLQIPAFASGVQGFGGGLAQINERGGEIVRLPSGADVIPHDLSKRMVDRPQMSGGNAELVTELRALRKEVADLRRDTQASDRKKEKLLQRSSDTLEKFDLDGLPEVRT